MKYQQTLINQLLKSDVAGNEKIVPVVNIFPMERVFANIVRLLEALR